MLHNVALGAGQPLNLALELAPQSTCLDATEEDAANALYRAAAHYLAQ